MPIRRAGGGAPLRLRPALPPAGPRHRAAPSSSVIDENCAGLIRPNTFALVKQQSCREISRPSARGDLRLMTSENLGRILKWHSSARLRSF